MKTMYFVIKAKTAKKAKTLLKSTMLKAGFDIANYNYICGITHIGYANHKIIKNSNEITNLNKGLFVLTVDKNIDAQYHNQILNYSTRTDSVQYLDKNSVLSLIDTEVVL